MTFCTTASKQDAVGNGRLHPNAATWRSGQILAHLLHYVKTWHQ